MWRKRQEKRIPNQTVPRIRELKHSVSLLFTAEIMLSALSSGINYFQTCIGNGSLKYYRPCDMKDMHNF